MLPAACSTAGVAYRKGKFAFAANGRSIANMDTEGFVKAHVLRMPGLSRPAKDLLIVYYSMLQYTIVHYYIL